MESHAPQNEGDRKSRIERPAARHRKRHYYPFIFTFLLMLVVWMLLSGRFDAFHLTLGIVSSALVAYFSSDLLFPGSVAKGSPLPYLRWAAYIPWLLCQIFRAGAHVMYLTFHPRLTELIDPQLIRFKSKLKSDLSLVTFANSITLTPGTITVQVAVDGEFVVHAIDEKSGESLPGEMEARIARTFGES